VRQRHDVPSIARRRASVQAICASPLPSCCFRADCSQLQPSRHPQVGKCKQCQRLRCVLLQALESHLHQTGLRVRKINSIGAGATLIYVYDQNHKLLGEYDANGNVLREYLWLDDMPIAVLTNDVGTLQALPVHADHLNTPRAVMDLDNSMRWSWTDPSDAFGKEPAANDPLGLGAVTFNLRFPGQVYDSESGMHYNVNRDYVPGMGRYAQSDPIGLAGGINTYAYVEGNPLSATDPKGLQGAAPSPFGPIPIPPLTPAPGPGGGGGRYDPRTDTFTPNPSYSLPSWLKRLTSKSELEQCEQDADDALERDYAYCKALGGTYNDYRTRKACEEEAFGKYVERLKRCKEQCR
jgi:RHS repeat-associated protein